MVVVAALLSAACGPDHRPDQCVAGHPNFIVLISAPPGKALPSDLTVTAHYGGAGLVTYHLNQTADQQVMFCNPAALDGGAVLMTDGAAPSSSEALRCELWTGGPATLDIDGMGYGSTTRELTPLESSCPLEVMIPLGEADAG